MQDMASMVGRGKRLSWPSHQSSQPGPRFQLGIGLDPGPGPASVWDPPYPPRIGGYTHLLTGFLMPWPSEPSPSPSFQPIFISIW